MEKEAQIIKFSCQSLYKDQYLRIIKILKTLTLDVSFWINVWFSEFFSCILTVVKQYFPLMDRLSLMALMHSSKYPTSETWNFVIPVGNLADASITI